MYGYAVVCMVLGLKRKALVLAAVVLTLIVIALVACFIQFQSMNYQLTTLQKENSNLQIENGDLAGDKRNLLFETDDMEKENEQLIKQLRDLTEQLALERELRVEITGLKSEGWTNYGSYLGVPRSRNVFNVNVRNSDAVALSGLRLTAEVFSGTRSVGGTFSWKIDLLMVGEEREIKGELLVPSDSLTDLEYFITLRCNNVVVDELRLQLTD